MGDINGDGPLDIIVTNRKHSDYNFNVDELLIYISDGEGDFSKFAPVPCAALADITRTLVIWL